MKPAKRIVVAIFLASALFLSACDTADERAEGHYQSALELIDNGDVDRALVELRNVFDLNGAHKEARILYATLLRERGETRDSYAQYLLSAEQYPDEIVTRRALLEMAIGLGNWREAERHGKRALELAPDEPGVIALAAILQYRTATENEDDAAREAAVVEVQAIIDQLEDPVIGRRVVIDNHIRKGELGEAIDELDRAVQESPDDQQLYMLRLSILGELREQDEIREQLEQMVERFPDEQRYLAALVQWYRQNGDTDAAIDLLRSRANRPDAAVSDKVTLAMFLRQIRGPEETRAELVRFIEQGEDVPIFQALLASLDFEAGERDKAIAAMEQIIETAEPSEQTRSFKVSLAQMLLKAGNPVGARQRVEEVLAEDSTQVEALKMRAAWMIEDDQADQAIVTLRTALDQAPQDPDVMTLMAQAHLRNGSRALAGELLSLAAEASNNAPRYALQYARFLLEEGNTTTAAGVLVDGLRARPGRIDLLDQLGRIYVQTNDWARAQQVEATLRRLGTEEGEQTATALEVLRLQRQNRSDEAISLLERLSDDNTVGTAADIAIVRSYFASRDFEQAEAFVNEKLAEEPDHRVMLYLKAAILSATDKQDEGEEIYRRLISTDPSDELVWRALFQLKMGQGKPDDAREVIEQAVAENPEAPNLLWMLASVRERDGDYDGAIDIYEKLYEENSGAIIVANNLASLLSTYRGDEELERAHLIARRLRGTEVPAFQDTYGWISLQRGFVEEGIQYLEPAAAALKEDPIVQYHLGMAYAKAERYEEAIKQLELAREVAGPIDTREQFDVAGQEIERLKALMADEEGADQEQ